MFSYDGMICAFYNYTIFLEKNLDILVKYKYIFDKIAIFIPKYPREGALMNCLQLFNQELGIDIAFWKTLPRTRAMHRHAFHEMVYIYQGYGIHSTEQGEYAIGPGDLLLVRPGTWHSYSDRQNMSLVNIMFDLGKIVPMTSPLKKDPVFRAFFELAPTLADDFRFQNKLTLSHEHREICEKLTHDLIYEVESRPRCWETNLSALLIKLFVQIVRACDSGRQSSTRNLVKLDHILAYLNQKYRARLVMLDLAEANGLSLKNMERLFRSAVQCTPLEYLNRLRLKEVERLLTTSDMAISEIADQTGFYDSNYLAKMFRKKYAISPRDFRKQSQMPRP